MVVTETRERLEQHDPILPSSQNITAGRDCTEVTSQRRSSGSAARLVGNQTPRDPEQPTTHRPALSPVCVRTLPGPQKHLLHHVLRDAPFTEGPQGIAIELSGVAVVDLTHLRLDERGIGEARGNCLRYRDSEPKVHRWRQSAADDPRAQSTRRRHPTPAPRGTPATRAPARVNATQSVWTLATRPCSRPADEVVVLRLSWRKGQGSPQGARHIVCLLK